MRLTSKDRYGSKRWPLTSPIGFHSHWIALSNTWRNTTSLVYLHESGADGVSGTGNVDLRKKTLL